MASPPIKKFKGHGGMEVAIWRNESLKGGVWYTVSVKGPQRKTEDGTWREVPINGNDMPGMIHLMNLAQQWLDRRELSENVQNVQNEETPF